MIVKDVMNRNVKTVHSEESVRRAAHIMNENRIGALVVISGSGGISGIVTERDILSNVVATGRSADDVKVSEIMSPTVITVEPGKTLEEAAEIMTSKRIKKLPVSQNGALVGIVTASDLIAYEDKLIEKMSALMTTTPTKNIGG